VRNGIAISAPSGSRLTRVIERGAKQVGPVFEIIRSPGYVYVFSEGTVSKLTGVGTEGPAGSPAFGASLSVSADGGSLAVGAAYEVGRQLTAYVFRLGSSGTWSLSNAIAPPSGASGSAISVAIDGDLAVTTNAPGSTTQGTLRFYQFGAPVLGPMLNATFTLDGSLAPVDLRAGRAIVGQPAFFGDVGYIATYAPSSPVVSRNPTAAPSSAAAAP
jgi:hypothetical protein